MYRRSIPPDQPLVAAAEAGAQAGQPPSEEVI
jgi:hypothetical protein